MRRPALALIAALAASSLASAAPAAAADFFVDSTDDEADLSLNGSCDAEPGAGLKCTLRAAVSEANDVAGADAIHLPDLGSDYDLSLTGAGEDGALSGDLDLTGSVTIQGSGQPVIDGLDADRVVHIGPSGSPAVTLSGIELRDGGAVDSGGGILVEGGTLGLSQVTVAANTAESASSGAEGGGVWIDSAGAHTIVASTLSGNTADGLTGAFGGGLGLGGPAVGVSITNSTISGNRASSAFGAAQGGGIGSHGGITLTQATLHQNTASGSGEAGGSVAALGGSVALRATIVSAGSAGPGTENCASLGASYLTLGSNLEAPILGSSQCGLSGGGSDRFASDAGLAGLADRGGPTHTHALLSTSAALDAVPSCFPLASDQRGEPRPSGIACEIGSFERQVAVPPGTGCFGKVPTIVAGPGSGPIFGTPLADVIFGAGGAEVIKGNGGNDLICSGKGNDRVFGGPGADRIAGGDGKDRLFGRGGNDSLLGNSGRDVLDGGKGRDLLNGGARRDNCRGGGRDKLKNC